MSPDSQPRTAPILLRLRGWRAPLRAAQLGYIDAPAICILWSTSTNVLHSSNETAVVQTVEAAAQADKQRAEERKRRAEDRAAAIVAKREAQGQEGDAQDGGDEDASDGGEADNAAGDRPEPDAAAGPGNRCSP